MTNEALKSELRESAITMANLPTEFGVACLTEAGAQRIAKALTDAATALEAMEAGGWLPISEAPKDEATYFLATNGSGVWVAHWQPVAGSGYRFDNPWRTVMLNHWHIEDKQRRYEPPTHWMPLPTPPKEAP
jgi:hypothetical protein